MNLIQNIYLSNYGQNVVYNLKKTCEKAFNKYIVELSNDLNYETKHKSPILWNKMILIVYVMCARKQDTN